MLFWLLVSCGPEVEPVPEDLETLFHFLWSERHTASDEVLHAALLNLDLHVDGASMEVPLLGRTEPLTAAEQALADLEHAEVPDPTRAVGMTLVNTMTCDLDTASYYLTMAAQDSLYDGFDAYERVFDGDWEAWLDREFTQLDWEVTYSVSIPIDLVYVAHLSGGVRWVPALEDSEDSPFGPFFLLWAYLTEPATFTSGEGDFDQDYRIEVYYQPTEGRVVHVEALWRQMQAGLVDTDSEVIQDLILDAILDIDAGVGGYCVDGLP